MKTDETEPEKVSADRIVTELLRLVRRRACQVCGTEPITDILSHFSVLSST